MEVIAEATDGWQAVRLAEELSPDVVLMDVRMPTMDGLEATRIIKARWPHIKIVVLTMYTTYRSDALTSKADAFVCKGDPPKHLVSIIEDLFQKETPPLATHLEAL
jgi:DNA-binding NarL/FixJ family response regulator